MIKKRFVCKLGFTLLEVMIFSVVSLMFIGLLAQVFITATRRTEDSRLRVDLQQSAVWVLRQFERDIAKTSTRAMSAIDGSHYVVAMTPVAQWNGNPGVSWQEQQTLYVYDKTKKTLHKELVTSYSEELSYTRPYIPSSGELMAVASTVSGQERILSSYIEEFGISDRMGNKTHFQSQPIKLEMKLRRPLSTSERYAEFTVQRRYTLRNAF